MANTKPIVQLRVYRSNGNGNQLSYDGNGNIQNTNQKVTEIYQTIEWANYLRHIRVHGFIKVTVEKVDDPNGKVTIEQVQKEVDKAMNPEVEKPLTPEQKQIAELKAMVEALSGGKKAESKDAKEVVNDDAELTKAREEYVKVFGKKGHHTWSVEQINEKIAEEQNK